MVQHKAHTYAPGGDIIEEQAGGRVIRSYRKGRLLGKGGFAECFAFTQVETGTVYAAKTISKRSLEKERTLAKLRTEIKIHRSLSHPNIVKFERYFEDSRNVYILLELCTQQSLMELHKRKKRLSEGETRYLMSQLISGTKHMHMDSVIHRDLKLGNVFLDENLQVKIGDFGLAAKLAYDGERKTTMCGTPNYIAPEILTGGGRGHSFEVDIWSLGVILFTLLVGSPPFETRDVQATYRKIKSLNYSFPPGIDISSEAKSLVSRILQTDPRRRPTLEEIEKDNFFTRHEVTPMAPPSLWPREHPNRRASAPAPVTAPPPTFPTPAGAAAGAAAGSRSPRVGNGLGVRASSSPRLAGGVPATARAQGVSPGTGVRASSSPRLAGGGFPRAASSPRLGAPAPLGDLRMPTVWVKEYADFTQRYGLAYRLSNGMVGATYNDTTKMIWDPHGGRVEYIARVRQTQPDGTQKRVDDLTVCTTAQDGYPQTLQKKITLIKYFHSYFQKPEADHTRYPVIRVNSANSPDSELKIQVRPTEDTDVARFPIVRSWSAHDQGASFKLSNKLFQCSFNDGLDIQIKMGTTPKTAICSVRGDSKRPVPIDAPTVHQSEIAFAVRTMKETSRPGTAAPSGTTAQGQQA